MSQNLGYAAVQQHGVGIALFTDIGNFAIPVSGQHYQAVVDLVAAETPLHEFDYLLTETDLSSTT